MDLPSSTPCRRPLCALDALSTTSRFGLVTFVLATLLWALPPAVGLTAAAEEVPGSAEELIPAAIDYYNEMAARPLAGLGGDDLRALLKGEVVVIRRKEKAPDHPGDYHHRVYGYLVVDEPMRSVWLSGHDPDYLHNETYRLAVYEQDGHGGNTAYTYVHTPWPLADRQTVTTVVTDLELTEESDGWIWAQSWDITPDQKRIARELVEAGKVDGVDVEMMEKAVWVPLNYGSFICFKLAERKTLFVWTATISVGGNIPDKLVAAFAANQLKSSLKEIAERASWIEKDYAEHPGAIYGGDGRIIQPLDSP